MRKRRHDVVAVLLAMTVFAGFAACSDDDLTVASGDVVGSWSGTTSQNRDLDFTVTSQGVMDGGFAYQMTGTCNFTIAQPVNASGGIPISHGKFTTGKTQLGTGVFLTIDGEFTSSTTARGTFLLQHAPCGDTLNLTWTATKQ